jgi:hypothetical protein
MPKAAFPNPALLDDYLREVFADALAGKAASVPSAEQREADAAEERRQRWRQDVLALSDLYRWCGQPYPHAGQKSA